MTSRTSLSVPPTPSSACFSNRSSTVPAPPAFKPLVAVVDFHHARGPEVEGWYGAPDGFDPTVQYDWPLLPFMALSDGAHAATQDFSYFTLLRPAGAVPNDPSSPATSLFGISCTRQIDSAHLLVRPADVTRSTVQKAVVVIADNPQSFGMLRERLSVVTGAWFAQRDFADTEILHRFQESLADERDRGGSMSSLSLVASDPPHADWSHRDQNVGMSLRELVRQFRWQTLVLLKCCLLQPKMLFFGSRCERLCMTQFSLISLIPGLLRNLQDCAGPDLNSYEQRISRPTSLRTSERNSLLSYMGLPLQIFGKGSFFGPYTPLQQLDILAAEGTKSYLVGSTNSLLLQQKDRRSDVVVNLDDSTITIAPNSPLRSALQLSTPDRRWIDFVTQAVNDTWDDDNPGRPTTHGYVGSEDFIRLQFEEYLLALVSTMKYHLFLSPLSSLAASSSSSLSSSSSSSSLASTSRPSSSRPAAEPTRQPLAHIDGDPSPDFGADFMAAWRRTENFRLWHAHTDSHLFDIINPKHPCAGGLSVEDIQRRIGQQVQDLHLDERLAHGREILGRNLAAGREKASSMLSKLYADVEALRDGQRKKAVAAAASTSRSPPSTSPPPCLSRSNSPGRGKSRRRSRSRLSISLTKRNSKPPSRVSSFGSSSSTSPHTSQQHPDDDRPTSPPTSQSAGSRASAYISSWTSWAGEKRRAATAVVAATAATNSPWARGSNETADVANTYASDPAPISTTATTTLSSTAAAGAAGGGWGSSIVRSLRAATSTSPALASPATAPLTTPRSHTPRSRSTSPPGSGSGGSDAGSDTSRRAPWRRPKRTNSNGSSATGGGGPAKVGGVKETAVEEDAMDGPTVRMGPGGGLGK